MTMCPPTPAEASYAASRSRSSAARFAAKLGFRIEQHTAAAIKEAAGLLDAIPAARLFDEILKLFLAGHGAATLKLLRRHHLLEHLFPEAEHHMARDVRAAELMAAAMNSDG